MSIFDNFTKEELEKVLHGKTTWRAVLDELGDNDKHNKMVPLLKRKLKELDIDFSFLDSTPNRRKPGTSRNQFTKAKDEEIFIKNGKRSLATVRRALKNRKDIPYKCAICGMPPEWQGRPLVLTMDHIDGDTTNNEPTNLRWICPNCDRQLPTYAGRNRSKVFKEFGITENVGKDKCPICGEWKWSRSQYCLNCRHKVQREHVPSRDALKSKIRETSFLQIGKEYGVSDNGVRKWCREYGLPSKTKDIKAISDKDWENI